MRLTGEESADATQIMRDACAMFPKPMSINPDAIDTAFRYTRF